MMKLWKIYTCKQCKNDVLFNPNLLKKALAIDIATMYRAPTTVSVPPLKGRGVRLAKRRKVKRKNKRKTSGRKRKTNVRKLITKILKT